VDLKTLLRKLGNGQTLTSEEAYALGRFILSGSMSDVEVV